jgi:hypothetical protein
MIENMLVEDIKKEMQKYYEWLENYLKQCNMST